MHDAHSGLVNALDRAQRRYNCRLVTGKSDSSTSGPASALPRQRERPFITDGPANIPQGLHTK